MGRFDKVFKAESYGQGNYLPCLTATYRVKILECKEHDAFNGGAYFIVEFEVLAVLVEPDERKDIHGRAVPKVGEKRTWMQDIADEAKGGFGRVKEFIAAINGSLPDNASAFGELAQSIVGSEQLFTGAECEVATFPADTKASKLAQKDGAAADEILRKKATGCVWTLADE